MTQAQPHRQATHPAIAGSDRTIDAWLRRELADAYDRTLGETLPDELIILAMSARPHH